jgi:hypothetical protein
MTILGIDPGAHGAIAVPVSNVEERFEQAKNPAGTPQFLQIAAKPRRDAGGGKPEPKLTRVAFKVSRLTEFCSERELQNQTGHYVDDWPLVVAKETFDNALDACEEAEVAPEIAIAVDPGAIIIQDNAGGIDAETIESILDYTVRVSSREAYVSPTRGAQGNALKTLLAMGYVLDRRREAGLDDAAGVTVIESRGVAHRIEFKVDHVNNQPRIVHTTAPSPIEVGTKIMIHWPPSKLLQWAEARSLDPPRPEWSWNMTTENTLAEAIEEAGLELRSGPLDVAIDRLKDAAARARKAEDRAADALEAFVSRLQPAFDIWDEVEKELDDLIHERV